MDRLLRPDKLDIDPESPTASQEWNHWYRTFQNFIATTQAGEQDKFRLLINHVSASIYDHISDCGTINDAITILKQLFVKPINEVFARHKLATRKQESGESVVKYLEVLKQLSKECNFKAVTAERNRDDCIRDAFISGLHQSFIRQRLLESDNLSLNDAFSQARALESAQHQSSFYQCPAPETINLVSAEENSRELSAAVNIRCYFCGLGKHPRSVCPAREAVCRGCSKKGHYEKVCQQRSRKVRTSFTSSVLSCNASASRGLSRAVVPVYLNGEITSALIDTGSTSSFVSEKLVHKLQLPVVWGSGMKVCMASSNLRSSCRGECRVKLTLQGHTYENIVLNVLPDLCSDIIIGHDILKQHSSVSIKFGGNEDPLIICALAPADMEPASLFQNLTPNLKPIAIKSRRHTVSDAKFIEIEVGNLLKDGIIEESSSPWRAQVLVVSDDNHKRRMVVDYSQTINRYTHLDAYPLPRIDNIVDKVSNYEVFSTIDLRSAYYQIPIKAEDKPLTAFEACGKLFQFTRIPFGVTNGVSAFQRKIDKIIADENLKDTVAYLDDVTICGRNQEEHDANLQNFIEAAAKYRLTINKAKSRFSVRSIHLLGYIISNKTIRPDPARLTPLRELPVPNDTSSLRRALGMFSHYSNFIPRFSEKVQILTRSEIPLNPEAIETFACLKKDVENAVVSSVDPEILFTVETDASEKAIAATLSQEGRPVAFFSRSLSPTEQHHAAVEKEAYAIIEAIRKWRHYLMGRHFRLITDQKSVSFMFNTQTSGKVKNEKILRWRLELSCYNYEIIYRPGKENNVADTFSRQCSAMSDFSLKKLTEIHQSLCHPGETRLYHWLRSKNLPYSLEEVRKVISACRSCSEIKPRFFKFQGQLIKATQPFERLNIDFKGPLPSCSRNKYLLIVVDEFSRFPFAFPCPNVSSDTVISKLKELFSTFGHPAYIHSDRGSSFMAEDLKRFLNHSGVATSRTTPYNPQGNGQAERFVGTVWKTVQLAMKSSGVHLEQWEKVLPEALNSIRSLLCTSTNVTPHERMFRHVRRSCHGSSTPTWLMTPGPILLRRNVRHSKYEPLVDEVTLLEGNSEYAHVRLPDGRETTVSTRHLAPAGELLNDSADTEEDGHSPATVETSEPELRVVSPPVDGPPSPAPPVLRRSERVRSRPAYLDDYST